MALRSRDLLIRSRDESTFVRVNSGSRDREAWKTGVTDNQLHFQGGIHDVVNERDRFKQVPKILGWAGGVWGNLRIGGSNSSKGGFLVLRITLVWLPKFYFNIQFVAFLIVKLDPRT